jgi:hypothetical protein
MYFRSQWQVRDVSPWQGFQNFTSEDVVAGGWQVGDVQIVSQLRMLWGMFSPMHQHRFIIAVNRNRCTP